MALLVLESAVLPTLLALHLLTALTWACLLCFTTYTERLRVCKMFTRVEGPELEQCEEAFTGAFEGLSDTEIKYEDRSNLHDTFAQMILSLQELAAAQGVQELTRRFLCRGCYSTVCDLPLDCPVQDVTVNRGDQAMFSCVVGFPLPEEEITYSWKFAGGGLRTQDVSYFRDMPRARGYLARIRPVKPTHRGTFSCVITHDQRPLARLYFFLNVTGPPPRGETELQVVFREVVLWAARDAETIEPWRPGLGELLARPEALTPGNLCLLAATAAFASASATVLVWLFFRWYLSGD
ncbi:sperm acrosome membrane-associated protein 6 [Ctenodactylus gundi]